MLRERVSRAVVGIETTARIPVLRFDRLTECLSAAAVLGRILQLGCPLVGERQLHVEYRRRSVGPERRYAIVPGRHPIEEVPPWHARQRSVGPLVARKE